MARILIADDSELMQQFYLASFPDYKLDVVGDGLELLRRAEGKFYDLILTDLVMPGMTGAEVATAIRRGNGPCKTTCICVLTGDPTEAAQSEIQAAGFDWAFEKPIPIEKLQNLFYWATVETIDYNDLKKG